MLAGMWGSQSPICDRLNTKILLLWADSVPREVGWMVESHIKDVSMSTKPPIIFSSHLKLNSQRIIDLFRPMTWKTPFRLGPWVVTTQHCFFVFKHQVFEVYFPSYSISSDKLDTWIIFSNIPYQFSRKQNKGVVPIN